MQNKIKKSPLNIIGKIVTIILALCVVAVFIISFIFTDKNSTPNFFGYSIFIMHGDNMEPAITDKAAVISKTGQLPEDPVGTVALCKITDDNITRVLRVVGVEENEGEITYLMRSDINTNNEIVRVPSDKIIGHSIYVSNISGIILSFATSKIGILLLIILPCAILLFIQLVHILKKISDKDMKETPIINNKKITDDVNIKNEQKKLKLKEDKNVEKPKLKENIINKNSQHYNLSDFNSNKKEEFAKEFNTSPKIAIDKNGKAEYIKSVPTADINDLNKVLKPVSSKTQQDKTNQIIDKLAKSFEKSKSKQTTPFQNAEKLNPQKNIESQPKESDNFIAPKPKKSSTNKTLEELMKMLDKEQDKLKNS